MQGICKLKQCHIPNKQLTNNIQLIRAALHFVANIALFELFLTTLARPLSLRRSSDVPGLAIGTHGRAHVRAELCGVGAASARALEVLAD